MDCDMSDIKKYNDLPSDHTQEQLCEYIKAYPRYNPCDPFNYKKNDLSLKRQKKIKGQSESLGEKQTRLILQYFNIKPIQQYRHELCINKRCLPFDFYVNKDNLHYFIEYNGGQHYRPVFGNSKKTKEEVFEYIKKNDLIKLNFCKKYNYPFLVIPYWIKDFENLISEFLKTTQFDPIFAQPTMPIAHFASISNVV
jgi:hypothetical protein